MKKLIIIGNGFDLAHGYATSYRDFILWLVKSEFVEYWKIQKVGSIDLPLFSCSISRQINNLESFLDKSLLEALLKGLKSNGPSVSVIINPIRKKHVKDINGSPLELKSSSSFGTKLLINSCESWVDIEQTYYDHLRIILNEAHQRPSYNKLDAINSLNGQLSYLCDKLKVYLSSITLDRRIQTYQELFNAPIDTSRVFKAFSFRTQYDRDEVGYQTHVLNFNYTSTVESYIDDPETLINQIHGSITYKNNPMIFGYGDELDDDFKTMENENVKGFLAHIKSLWYLRTTNYHDLLRFIESDYYQVQIFGHSCGRTDRTLLNMIFEHENCNSINIFYRRREDGTDNFNEIAEEISRQFKDKQKLRKRVLPKNIENILPQYYDEVAPAIEVLF